MHSTQPSATGLPFGHQSSSNPGMSTQWQPQTNVTLPEDFDILAIPCGCGDSCTCPGCAQHRGSSVILDADTCRNPRNCMACQSCAIDRMADAYFREHASELINPPNGSQFPGVGGDWIPQSSQSPGVFPPTTNNAQQNFAADLSGMALLPQFMNMGLGINMASGSNPSASYSSLLPPQHSYSGVSDRSSARGSRRCRCPPGQCSCSEGSCECEPDYQRSSSSPQSCCVSSRPFASTSTSSPAIFRSSMQYASMQPGYLTAGPSSSTLRRSSSSGSHSSGRSNGSSSGSEQGVVRQRPIYPRDTYPFP